MLSDKEYLDKMIREIGAVKTEWSLMEVCGTHTMAIAKSGLRELLPENIKLLTGPGCPVCVTAQGDIDAMIDLSRRSGVMIATFGDMIRVPGTDSSFQEERGKGASINVVYSPLDALQLARDNPDREVIFIGIGFETTAPAVGSAVEMAAAEGLNNFSVLSQHKIVPPALEAIFSDNEIRVDGLICPGHVSAVIGLRAYDELVERHQKACVVTGFETRDILEGIVLLLRQLESGRLKSEIQYRRVVRPEGNKVARAVLSRVFEPIDARWRGLGTIGASGLALAPRFAAWDAKRKFDLPEYEDKPIKGCACGEVLKGKIAPDSCALFGRGCTPIKPIGPCMVSSEGACAAFYRYRVR